MSQVVPPAGHELAEIGRLHAAGRYLDAFRYSEAFSAPETWQGTDALILAGRLMFCWGDCARAQRLHSRAWHIAPDHPPAIYYRGLVVDSRHGPLEGLRFLREQNSAARSSSPIDAHGWMWLHEARLLATFRDFDAAEELLHRAQSVVGHEPWWWVERSRLLEMQDRYAEALESTTEALRLQPRYRPALESRAQLLMLLNRDDEALALLQDANAHLQIASLAQMLAVYFGELERYTEVLPVLDLAEVWQPCASREQQHWLAGRRADALRHLGRDPEAAAFARAAGLPFQSHLADRLANSPFPRQPPVLCRVRFVRQHHMTCAPATLTALAQYWHQPVDHLELARLICYDGTPDHEERHWAETHGWIVREFRVTWETTVALLDRGCPFTLTTVSARSAHLQAVVGYDAALGLLLIRDPYQRIHGECIAQAFLDSCASHGPRGMVLIPAARGDLVEGIVFSDAKHYDIWYALRRAIIRHDRTAAQNEYDRLLALDPNHRLTHLAHREIALYDGNLLRQLDSTRALLALFPDDPNFLLDEAQYLRALGRVAEQRARVAALVNHRHPDPLFLRECAEMLAGDARTHLRAHRLYRRVLRRRSVDAWNLHSFANFLWSQQHFAPAAELYRLAACVGDKTEAHWDSYFSASRHVRAADACLTLLRQRDERLGAQSGHPARTLFRALEGLDQTSAGFSVLEAALARRPDDGELLLFAAECRARFGQRDEATRLLAAAAAHTARHAWLRTAARLAEIATEHTTALDHWRELLALNPVDLDSHRAVARLLATLEGRAAALEFLRTACATNPSLIPLHTLFLEWLRTEPPAAPLAIVDHLLTLDPTNAWALREKALILLREQRHDEALTLTETACRIEPHSSLSPGVHGLVLAALGRTADARTAFEASLRLALDSGYMGELINHSADFAARGAAVAFLQSEFARQPLPEDGTFLRFREIARAVLSPADTHAALEAILAAHPNHWAAWSALGTHLVEQGETDAGLARAREAAERFPLSPRTWLDLAIAQSHAHQPDAEIESLRRALELSPGWGRASRTLALAHERALHLDAAEHVHRRALAADPLDGIGHGHLADLLWRRGCRAEAITLMERAIALEPGFDWAWERIDEWAKTTPETTRAVTLAEARTQFRPGDPQAWLRLARLQARDPAVALTTLDRARALNPRDTDIHDLRASLLCDAGRYDEALAACRPAAFGEPPPRELQGRAAWIEHARGHPAAAVVQMRLVVNDHPDYTWGWTCLTEWLWSGGEPQPALEAATKWAWLSPANAQPLGYAAAAHQRMGQRREAKDTLWRALHRDPTYIFGAQTLLQWLAEDRDLDEAARLLRHIETHFSPPDAQRATVLFHIMQKDKPAATAAFATLARSAADRLALVRECATAFSEAGWRSVTEKTLFPLLADPTLGPHLARLWVDAWAPDHRWRELRQLKKIAAPESVQRAAWSAVLEHLGRTGAVWRLLWLRYYRREWLRAKADTWGSLGYALSASGLRRATIGWLKTWPSITDLQPWMLYNLTLAYYQRKNPAAARAVIAHARTLPADNTQNDFLLWHGLESALVTDLPAAAESLAKTAHLTLDPQPKLIRALIQLLVDFHARQATAPSDAFREAKVKLTQIWDGSPSANSDPSLVHFRARVLRHLGAASGSWLTHAQSYLPPSGRSYTAPSTRNALGENWWVIWIAILALSSLSRNCSGH